MDHLVTANIVHMAKSHQELARILGAKKDIAVNMSQVTAAIPDSHSNLNDVEVAVEHAMGISKSVSAYLSSLADLEEAMADNLSHIIAELNPNPDHEE